MKRILLFMIIFLLFEVGAKIELMNLSQQRDALKEHLHIMNSATVVLEIRGAKW